MVTHNGELAEEYSTRIIKVKDGVVLDDTNPYDGKEEEKNKDENTSENESKKKTKKTSMSLEQHYH